MFENKLLTYTMHKAVTWKLRK